MATPDQARAALAAFEFDLAEVSATASEDMALAAFWLGTTVPGDGVVLVAAADPEVDLYVVALAVTAIIIAWGFNWIVARPLAWIVSKIPFFGGTLASWITSLGNWEQQNVWGFMLGALDGLALLIGSFFTLAIGLIISAGHLLMATAGAVNWIIGALVPYSEAVAHNFTVTEVTQESIYRDYGDHVVLNYAAGVRAELLTDLNSLQTAENAQIAGVATALNGELNATEVRLGGEIQQQGQSLLQYIGDAVQKVELEIGRAESTAHDYTDSSVQHATDTLGAEITSGLAAVTALADGIGNNLRKLQTECTDTQCEAYNTNANNVLKLAGLLNSGLLFGFFAAAIRDPEGTTAATVPILEPLGAAAGGLVNTLVTAIA